MSQKRAFERPAAHGGWIIARAVCAFALAATPALAADHDDTPALKAAPRHEARITDLHVLTKMQAGPGRKLREHLVLSLSTNPTIPPEATSYTFPSDLTLAIHIDRNSKVDFDVDPGMTARYGGKILKPAKIASDITFTVTFDEEGEPTLETDGLDEDVPVQFFAGLRDDPFIRGPRQGRNVGSIVIELPLNVVAGGNGRKTLLVWANSSVPAPGGTMGDLGARALRSQLAPELDLNDFDPSHHLSDLGMVPDVVIFNPSKGAAFPNGRRLGDDVVDLVGDAGVLSNDCPVPGNPVKCYPMSNDQAFLESFPYLAPPHPAP